jgi:hypothetical protein
MTFSTRFERSDVGNSELVCYIAPQVIFSQVAYVGDRILAYLSGAG